MLNPWTKQSVRLAAEENYLDQLFAIYPMNPEQMREIEPERRREIERAFQGNDDAGLINALLNLNLFPIKDSYVPYVRSDRTSLARNPETVKRISTRVRAMGLDGVFDAASAPKETNRQIGPMFKQWIKAGNITTNVTENERRFEASAENIVFTGSDESCMRFAARVLNYERNKGLDLLAKFNGKYIIGEAKFLTDVGGHQNAQFEDAITLLQCDANAMKVAILDGVLYQPGPTGVRKMFQHLQNHPTQNILSALILQEFLESA